MAFYPNIALTLPDPSVSLGPAWAATVNAAFAAIDNHDHTGTKGLPIRVAAITIDADLTFKPASTAYSLLGLKLARFDSQSGVLTGGLNLNQVYVVNGNLYFQDSSGTNIQITSGGAVNIAGVGGITGLAATTAAVTYSDITKTFAFTQNSNFPAKIDGGSIAIHEVVSGGKAVTLSAPGSLGSNYTLTLPTALPGTNQSLALFTTAGVWSFLGLGAANTSLRVNAAGTALEYATIDTNWITNLAITTAKLADSNVTAAKIETDVNLPGNNVKLNGQNAVCSANPSSKGLKIVRGRIRGSDGATLHGEGFSAVRNSAGNYTVTFSAAFSDTPTCVTTASASSGIRNTKVSGESTTLFGVNITDLVPNNVDADFNFIAIGQR